MTIARQSATRARAPLRRVGLPVGVSGCLSDAPGAAHWQAAGGVAFLCGRADERAAPLPPGKAERRRTCRACAREKAAYDATVEASDERQDEQQDDGGDWVDLAWPNSLHTACARRAR